VPSDLLTPRHSDTERVIRKSQAIAGVSPKDAKAFAALGAAYVQRARETGDVSDYELAEQALNKSLDLSPSDFSSDAALESLAEVCMGEHRFADALTYAQKALSLGSGNLSPFAIAGDAYADMGEYDKAREAYGKLAPAGMAISPRAAYARDSRLAYLDFAQGDTRGAILLMTAAVAEGSEASIPSENQAWLYYELGEFHAQAGDAADADAAYLTALKANPGDYRALAGLARLRANHGRYDEAITLYRKAIAVVPMPTFVAELGDIYQKAGRLDEAKKEYDLVEYIGRLGKVNQVLHNRDLALFYSDHDIKLGEALELARKEFEVRRDIYTWDALAWALYKNGKFAEAEKASDEALKYGTRDALLLFHAATIAGKLGQQERARIQLKMALSINPNFSLRYSTVAQDELAKLDADARPRESEASNAR
jgi:tetratricopeptide (TPR) repeat protein